MFRHVLTSSTQPEIWSIHVVVRTRTAKKCTKPKNARAGRAELLFSFIRAIALWRFRSRRRRRNLRKLPSKTTPTPTSTSSKNIITRYRNNLVITPSTLLAEPFFCLLDFGVLEKGSA